MRRACARLEFAVQRSTECRARSAKRKNGGGVPERERPDDVTIGLERERRLAARHATAATAPSDWTRHDGAGDLAARRPGRPRDAVGDARDLRARAVSGDAPDFLPGRAAARCAASHCRPATPTSCRSSSTRALRRRLAGAVAVTRCAPRRAAAFGARDEASHHRCGAALSSKIQSPRLSARDVANLPVGRGQRDARAAADGHLVEPAALGERQPPAVARDRADRIAIADDALLLGGRDVRQPRRHRASTSPAVRDQTIAPTPAATTPRRMASRREQSARRSSSHGVLV